MTLEVNVFRSPVFAVAAVLLTGGCRGTGAHSPTVDVIGSYFPAWMLCIVVGIGLTIVARQVLIGLKLNDHLHPAPLVYLGMIVLWTHLVWLVYFKN
jgi:hypothetical protein